MKELKDIFRQKKADSDERLDEFCVEETSSVKRITKEAYLEKRTWLKSDQEFVCLFVDLDGSSSMSFRHEPETMAKIYDYFTQNVVDFMGMESFDADYIDIKGDGAFGIFKGDDASARALCAAITFKTFFDKVIRHKFQGDTGVMNCKMGISKNGVLVKKIGVRGDWNEVWAGRVVNNAAKLASLSSEIYETEGGARRDERVVLLVSNVVYQDFEHQEHAVKSCGHDEKCDRTGRRESIWQPFDCQQKEYINDEKVWYMTSRWCDECGDEFMREILNGAIC